MLFCNYTLEVSLVFLDRTETDTGGLVEYTKA
jgi:hypothetical protein